MNEADRRVNHRQGHRPWLLFQIFGWREDPLFDQRLANSHPRRTINFEQRDSRSTNRRQSDQGRTAPREMFFPNVPARVEEIGPLPGL